MKIWIKILITALVAGALLGFTLFTFYFFEVQTAPPTPSEPTLCDMVKGCRAIPYGVMFFMIMLVAEIAWYSDLLFEKKR